MGGKHLILGEKSQGIAKLSTVKVWTKFQAIHPIVDERF